MPLVDAKTWTVISGSLLSKGRNGALPAPTAPSTNAGVDKTNIAQGSTVTLTAVDTPGTNPITSSSWAWVSGGTAPTLSGTGLTRTYTAPASQVTQVFRRTVSDGTLSDTDDVSVTTAAGVTAEVVPGWLRTASNTGLAGVGVTVGMLTAYSGSSTITGTQYRKQFNLGSGFLTLSAGATLEECQINSTRSGGGMVVVNGEGVTIKNCDIIGTNATTNESMGITGGGGGMLVQGVRMTGTTIFSWLDGDSSTPSVIDQCYWYDQVDGGQSHHDGFTRRAGTNPITIKNTRIDCSVSGTTGSIFTQSTWGDTVANITVEDSYLEGGGYNFALESSSNLTILRNRTRPQDWGSVSRTNITNLTWSENYVYANTPGNDYKGALIPTP